MTAVATRQRDEAERRLHPVAGPDPQRRGGEQLAEDHLRSLELSLVRHRLADVEVRLLVVGRQRELLVGVGAGPRRGGPATAVPARAGR